MFHAQITLLILKERLEKQLKVQEFRKMYYPVIM